MLAIHGGAPTIRYPFTKYNSIGIEEQNAALRVLKSGNLSSFIGANEPDFYGGSEIKAWRTSGQISSMLSTQLQLTHGHQVLKQ